MDDYIQIGVTALRDPVTGEALEAVPLYVRKEDVPGAVPPLKVGPLSADWAESMRNYVEGLEESGIRIG